MDPLLAPLNTAPIPLGAPPEDEEDLAAQQDPMYWLRKLADAASAGPGSQTPGQAGPQII